MQFDSTAYLIFNLKDKLNLNETYIENCVRFLNGFVIKPGSIKYDENGNSLTLSMSLPNSEMLVYGVTIDPCEGIIISLSINGIIINILYKIYNPSVYYSILSNDENNHNFGIYYYNPSVFDSNVGRFKGQYTFYDASTLKTIIDSYDLIPSVNVLINLIGTNSEKINNLGFVPDITIWEEESSNEKSSDEKIIDDINNKIRTINYDSIMDKLSTFSKEYESVNKPISFGRN